MSDAKTRSGDEHVDPLIGGLQGSTRPQEGLAMKWRIVIALLVLLALVVIVWRQAY